MTERAPRGGWIYVGYNSQTGGTAWRKGGLLAISSYYENAELPDGSGVGPQWLVTVSFNGARPNGRQVRAVLRDFGLIGAEEDNHHPGIARHFWQPVNPANRVECQCKTDETLVVEPDGYKWTNPTIDSGEGCRGCDLRSLTGRTCPLHPEKGGKAA